VRGTPKWMNEWMNEWNESKYSPNKTLSYFVPCGSGHALVLQF